jgi:hypothetical protein
MSRLKAAAWHLALTVGVLAAIFAVARTLWYPHPLFTADGAWQAYGLLVGIGLILGPVLTLMVFRAGKKGLRSDLALIVIAQVIALAFGVHLLYTRRIQMVVYSQGAFHALDGAHIALIGAKGRALLRTMPGRPAYVYVELPHSKKAMLGVEIRTLQGEPPVFLRGWRYRPYTATERKMALTDGYPLVTLARTNPVAAAAISHFRKGHRSLDHYVFVPLRGTYTSVMLALDRGDGQIVATLPFNPGLGKPPA